ncbi:unnamed protein product [Heligmosomoides polygyrus]|uniref:Uncharacterized protein n=1 Tax=Heligmosomoides polygyrus TaxID=6339 RepID=A0A183G2E6_HELPZ|nr:unnamed protein product [Heligmosomoides polygyrus]
MQNNMLAHQQLMQQAALQAAMQARTLPSTMQNSYMPTAAQIRSLENANAQQLRPLDPSQPLRPIDSAQQMRQLDQNAAAAAMAAQQLQRQLPPQMLQNQALQMRNQQMTVHDYQNLLRLAQPAAALPQRRQTISGTTMNPQMTGTVPRLQRPATTMAPPFSSALQYQHQMAAPPLSLATPIPIQQQNLFAQQLMSNAMRATGSNMAPPQMPPSMASVTQPQTPSNPIATAPTNSSGGMEDAEFMAFLENVRQIEAHLTRTLAESIQRSTAAQQSQ